MVLLVLVWAYKHVYQVFFWGICSTLVLVVVLAVLFATFSSSFLRFHELVFQDTSWQLVPGRDVLLSIFPEQFFKDVLLRVMVQTVLVCFATLSSMFIVQRFKKKSSLFKK